MKEKNEIIFIQLTPDAYQSALVKASTLGAMRAMQLCGVPIREMLSRAELDRRFGRGKVDQMVRDNKLIPHRMDNGRSKYLLSEVLTLLV